MEFVRTRAGRRQGCAAGRILCALEPLPHLPSRTNTSAAPPCNHPRCNLYDRFTAALRLHHPEALATVEAAEAQAAQQAAQASRLSALFRDAGACGASNSGAGASSSVPARGVALGALYEGAAAGGSGRRSSGGGEPPAAATAAAAAGARSPGAQQRSPQRDAPSPPARQPHQRRRSAFGDLDTALQVLDTLSPSPRARSPVADEVDEMALQLFQTLYMERLRCMTPEPIGGQAAVGRGQGGAPDGAEASGSEAACCIAAEAAGIGPAAGSGQAAAVQDGRTPGSSKRKQRDRGGSPGGGGGIGSAGKRRKPAAERAGSEGEKEVEGAGIAAAYSGDAGAAAAVAAVAALADQQAAAASAPSPRAAPVPGSSGGADTSPTSSGAQQQPAARGGGSPSSQRPPRSPQRSPPHAGTPPPPPHISPFGATPGGAAAASGAEASGGGNDSFLELFRQLQRQNKVSKMAQRLAEWTAAHPQRVASRSETWDAAQHFAVDPASPGDPSARPRERSASFRDWMRHTLRRAVSDAEVAACLSSVDSLSAWLRSKRHSGSPESPNPFGGFRGSGSITSGRGASLTGAGRGGGGLSPLAASKLQLQQSQGTPVLRLSTPSAGAVPDAGATTPTLLQELLPLPFHEELVRLAEEVLVGALTGGGDAEAGAAGGGGGGKGSGAACEPGEGEEQLQDAFGSEVQPLQPLESAASLRPETAASLPRPLESAPSLQQRAARPQQAQRQAQAAEALVACSSVAGATTAAAAKAATESALVAPAAAAAAVAAGPGKCLPEQQPVSNTGGFRFGFNL